MTVLDTVIHAFAAELQVPRGDIDPDLSLTTLQGADSVTMLRAVIAIEEALSVAIPDDVLFEALTARELAEFVTRLRDGAAGAAR
jgi:acyl carrier protein